MNTSNTTQNENKAKTKSARSSLIYFIVVVSLVLFAVILIFYIRANRDRIVVKVNDDMRISALLSDTESERVAGLSGRKSIGQKQGMLFVLDDSSDGGIWMKDMKFAIDIVWLNRDKQVITLKENITPETYPEMFYPTSDADYVLEVQSGFVKQHNIQLGDTFVF